MSTEKSKCDMVVAIEFLSLVSGHFDVALIDCDFDPVEYVFTVRQRHRRLVTSKYASGDFEAFCKKHNMHGSIFFDFDRTGPTTSESVVVFSMSPKDNPAYRSA